MAFYMKFTILILTSYFTAYAKQTNIILILADDLGYGDVGYHGYPNHQTPHIDELAQNGVIFSQGYSCASVCGPARSGLLTGVYQQKMGIYGNMGTKGGVPLSQPILPEILKNHGYQTAVIGKWGIGLKNEKMLPNHRGVDFFYGFLGGSHSYTKSSSKPISKKPNETPIYRNQDIEPPLQKSTSYLTERFNEEAIGFIDRNHQHPFFMYLAYNAVHSPWEVPDSYKERLKHLNISQDQLVFRAMKLAMDDGIGRLVKKLKHHGIFENSLIIFLSDNGSPRGQGLIPDKDLNKDRGGTTMSSPGPYRGFKGDVFEGGIRIPFFMHWPQKIKAPTIYSKPVISIDIAPTVIEATNSKKEKGLPFDGVNLFPYLQKADTSPHSALFWRRGNDYAILKDGWKLQWNDAGSSRKIQLFNLDRDPEERKDLSFTHPEKAQTLQNDFDAWDSSLPSNQTGKKFINRNLEYSNGKRIHVAKFNSNIHIKKKNNK